MKITSEAEAAEVEARLSGSKQWRVIKIVIDALGQVLPEFVEKHTAPLVARIDALETEAKGLKEKNARTFADYYKGTWQPGTSQRGDLVTSGGSLWLCFRETTAKPGAGDDWRLVVKRGADGRDAADRRNLRPGDPA